MRENQGVRSGLGGSGLVLLWKPGRQAVVKGGPLNGARYLDVSEEQLRKAAKNYCADARFKQFAEQAVDGFWIGRSN